MAGNSSVRTRRRFLVKAAFAERVDLSGKRFLVTGASPGSTSANAGYSAPPTAATTSHPSESVPGDVAQRQPSAQPLWRETAMIPADGEAICEGRFEDFPGVFVVHCHRLKHEDKGMMQRVELF